MEWFTSVLVIGPPISSSCPYFPSQPIRQPQGACRRPSRVEPKGNRTLLSLTQTTAHAPSLSPLPLILASL
ncbi:hypothetical protein IE53DRAFT_389584 [Violaceomyces palustris]|uniref:Uncharacterized protein n=1 Tax=Violaceomyces palustris TaxID=1673888 RepID=A0ACD0NQZ4_9BASI|nr:hypothetical protein IE53DRAFT_389584 [Violaceomyces palustris]